MKVKDITAVLEEVAPLSLQEDFDNSGLLVGDPESEIRSALLCVDITEAVLEEAISLGADMVISHHPVIFHPLKHITCSTYIERVVAGAIRSGIALYASHTNLDSAPDGMSHRLGNLLGLKNVSILVPSAFCGGGAGTGIVGEPAVQTQMSEFLGFVKSALGLKVLRYSDIAGRGKVTRVALCTGAGGAFVGAAKASGAEVYISSDFRYNNFLDADRDIVIVDIGHFESEYCAIDLLYDIIRKKIPTFALHKSKNSTNPVHYLV